MGSWRLWLTFVAWFNLTSWTPHSLNSLLIFLIVMVHWLGVPLSHGIVIYTRQCDGRNTMVINVFRWLQWGLIPWVEHCSFGNCHLHIMTPFVVHGVRGSCQQKVVFLAKYSSVYSSPVLFSLLFLRWTVSWPAIVYILFYSAGYIIRTVMQMWSMGYFTMAQGCSNFCDHIISFACWIWCISIQENWMNMIRL